MPCSPAVLGFYIPDVTAPPCRLGKHRARCTVASLPHTQVGVAVAGDAHFKYHVIESVALHMELLTPREGGGCSPQSQQQPSLFGSETCLLLSAVVWSPVRRRELLQADGQ